MENVTDGRKQIIKCSNCNTNIRGESVFVISSNKNKKGFTMLCANCNLKEINKRGTIFY